ncbi:MAG: type IV pilin protein [Candidatus Omnitrophota bacterium]
MIKGAFNSTTETVYRGFTIVEIVMVAFVIGIVAVIAVPQYRKFVERSRAAEAVSMLNTIRSAQRVYKLEYNQYMSSVNYLVHIKKPTLKWWDFEIENATGSSMTAKAKRTSADGGDEDEYIELEWNDSSGATWSGTHPGTPK